MTASAIELHRYYRDWLKTPKCHGCALCVHFHLLWKPTRQLVTNSEGKPGNSLDSGQGPVKLLLHNTNYYHFYLILPYLSDLQSNSNIS